MTSSRYAASPLVRIDCHVIEELLWLFRKMLHDPVPQQSVAGTLIVGEVPNSCLGLELDLDLSGAAGWNTRRCGLSYGLMRTTKTSDVPPNRC